MHHIEFRNPGCLEMDFIRMSGVSVKSEQAIGFFGTGLKYAIAVILRHGGEVKIWNGSEHYRFETVDKELRGKTFQQVVMVHEDTDEKSELLPFTTELGKHWHAWMAIRELFSNAIDEGGSMRIGTIPMHNFGETVIAVEGEAFHEIYRERRKYFILPEETPHISTPHADIYLHGRELCEYSGAHVLHPIFYKGIMVGMETGVTQFRYNVKDNLTLTEDRTAQYAWQIREAIEKAILTCEDEEYIHGALVGEHMESTLGFSDAHASVICSEQFIEVCQRLQKQMPQNFNRKAGKWLDRRAGRKEEVKTVEMTSFQQRQLDEAIECVKALGYSEELETYPIKIAANLGERVFGRAQHGNIYLTRDCFEKGSKFLASTLLEEFIHLKYGYVDCSRDLQTFLFDKVISLAEEHLIGRTL